MIPNQQLPTSVPRPRPIPGAAKPGRSSLAWQARRKRHTLILSGAGAGLLILAGAVLFGGSPGRKQAPHTASSEATRGLPSTLTELNRWYSEPPAGQNAATYYSRGFRALQIGNASKATLPFFGNGQMPVPGTPVPVSMRKDLAGLLKANREALRHFAEGAKYERCRYPLDLTQGYDLVYRSFTKLETASLLMELSTLSHADSKQPEQAASDVSIGLALVNSLSDAPTTLAQLLRARMISYVLAGLEQAINRSFLPETACVDLSRAFQKMEGRDARGDSFNRTLAGERAQALAALGNPRQLLRALEAPDLKMSAEERSRIKARLHSGEMLTAERDFFEDAFSQLQAARQAPFPERLKADALGRQLMALSTENNLPVLDLFLPGLCRRAALEAECLAELRLGWTAVALERFRTVHDQQYPARLSQLSPEYLSSIPTDPFDGHPLRYQQHGGGYTLYSIGPDLKDDSGQPMNRKDGDIVFTVVTSVR